MMDQPPSFKDAKLPPFSTQGEQGVLGCILLSPNECMGECVEKIRRDHFYDLRHRAIWECFLELYEDNIAFDLIIVQQRLKDKGQLESVGGLVYLATLPDAVPSAANLNHYIEIIREKYVLRRIIQACTDAVQKAYAFKDGSVDELADSVESEIHAISESRSKSKQRSMKELVNLSITKIEEYHQSQGKLPGISTGLPDLDRMTCGMNGGQMIMIGGRPGAGKSAISMQIAEHVAVEGKLPVGVFSLEMTDESLVMRMLCSRSRVNLRNIRDGYLAERDFPNLTSSAGKLSSAPIYIDDSCGISILQLRAKARRMQQLYNIRLVVIDYLQLVTTSKRCDNRNEEVTNISQGIKAMARELNLPVIVLSQLNRDVEKRGGKPRSSDLRESGALEQDSDVIMLLYTKPPKEGEEDDFNEEAVPVTLSITKQREGPTGDIDLVFLKPYTRLECAARVSTEDVP